MAHGASTRGGHKLRTRAGALAASEIPAEFLDDPDIFVRLRQAAPGGPQFLRAMRRVAPTKALTCRDRWGGARGRAARFASQRATGEAWVVPVSDRAGLLELLGPIDAPSEAALVALAAGHRMPCKEANVREEDGRFVLKGTRGSTCGSRGIEHYEVFVSSSGDVSECDSELVERAIPTASSAAGRRPSAPDRGCPARPGVSASGEGLAKLERSCTRGPYGAW